MVDINLLPEQEKKEIKVNKAKVIATFVAITIIGLNVVVFFILLGTYIAKGTALNGKKEDIRELSENLSSPEYIEVKNMVLDLKKQISVFESLTTTHKKWSEIINILAKLTPKNIQYKIFSMDAKGKVTLEGTADSYERIGLLMEIIKKTDQNGQLIFTQTTSSPYLFKDVELNSIAYEKGGLKFSLTFSFN